MLSEEGCLAGVKAGVMAGVTTRGWALIMVVSGAPALSPEDVVVESAPGSGSAIASWPDCGNSS